MLRDALTTATIALSAGFFSTTMNEREAKEKIRDELTRFAIVVEPAKTLFGRVRKTYTGKLGGQQDDLAISVQLAMIGQRTFFTAPKYRGMHSE